ncbi:MAG: AmmeMemoRadiSam system radical SAM enzyme [Thermoplasmatota archaeon]
MKEAMYWEAEQDKIRCKLCPQNCLISEGDRGLCNVRKNIEGKLYSLIYGKVASLAVDPIEKKPLYHFYPGTSVLSHGSMGCNLKCKFCQNASLSNGDPESPYLKEYTVAELADQALNYDGIAWTYNEPTITYEYSLDVSKKIKEMDGGYVVYVTNGFINNDPLEELSPYLDAMNIDIKAFHDDFYRKIVGGRLQPVLDTAVKAVESGIHVEITYLIIPGYNDEYEEIEDFSEWVMHNLGEDTVVHFSRFHPDHDMRDVPSTPEKTMKKARETAKKVGLNFVYLGNLPADNDTKCPECGATIISRSFFSSGRLNLQDGKCPECGRKIPIIY